MWDLTIRTERNRHDGVPDIRVYEPAHWPPAPPQQGDSVFFAGWPEVAASVDVPNMGATFQPYGYAGATVTEMTDHGFTIEVDRAKFRGITGRETQQQLQERDLSELSGSPIFRDNSAGSGGYELVGFIKEYAPKWDIFFATSAVNIRADDLRVERYVP